MFSVIRIIGSRSRTGGPSGHDGLRQRPPRRWFVFLHRLAVERRSQQLAATAVIGPSSEHRTRSEHPGQAGFDVAEVFGAGREYLPGQCRSVTTTMFPNSGTLMVNASP